jgi:hypothetical protein
VACLIATPGVLGAQADSTVAVHAAQNIAQRAICFQARPLGACRAWIPFMLTAVFRVGNTSRAVDSQYGYAPGNELDFRQFGAWDIGYMRNRDSSDAIGGLIEVGTRGFDKRFALKARGQHWLSPSWTVSGSVGLLSAKQQAAGADRTTHAYGATADVGVDFEDQMGVVVTGDVTRQSAHQATALRVGVRDGSYAAVWAAGLFAVIDIIIFSPLGHDHLSNVAPIR